MVNSCIDTLQQYNVDAAQSTLEDAQSTMQALYVCFWISIGFVFAEFLFWVVFAVDARMSRITREHISIYLKENKDDSDGQPTLLTSDQAYMQATMGPGVMTMPMQ